MTDRFGHALVLGKFYPPHAGHLRLVHHAAATSEHVTLLVLGAASEKIALADRVAWLSEALGDHPHVSLVARRDDAPVDYEDSNVWDAHMAVFTDAVAASPFGPIDVVVTGEDYGDELAQRLGVAHERLYRPGLPTGTACRSDLAKHWNDLIAPARRGLARRIIVLGVESSGTTTLAHDLARALGAPFVPEWGRTHAARKLAELSEHDPAARIEDVTWSDDDFTLIAATQSALADEAVLRAPLIVMDTDALATSVWHERYVGGPFAPALALAAYRPATLYLLTSPAGVPFEDDGLRDGEHVRVGMHHRFLELLDAGPVPYVVLEGSPTERLRGALGALAAHAPSPFAIG